MLESAFVPRIQERRSACHVIDIRNVGLMAAIELEPRPHASGARGIELQGKCFENGVVVRNVADVIQIAPFLNGTEAEIEDVLAVVERSLATVS